LLWPEHSDAATECLVGAEAAAVSGCSPTTRNSLIIIMGNCTSGQKKKKKGNSTDGNTDGSNENKPNDDVTYASINHPTGQGLRPEKATNEYEDDNDCDYAT
ncbi:hypothetical protein CCH79_00002670, partial [Gambusia affinis]